MARHEGYETNDGDKKHVTVLVTGFGPFQKKFPVNPSFEIVKSLPKRLPSSPKERVVVRIIPYEHPVRVSYSDVRKLVPVLHQTYAKTVDLVLHIGMASGQSFYEIESCAHRDGYTKTKDLDGELPPADEGSSRFKDCPAIMKTSLDFADILQRWRANVADADLPKAGADCRPSDDAGHFLCDYIYYNSLALYGKNNKHLTGGSTFSRPIMFLHVPAESDKNTMQTSNAVAIALIRAMAESCMT